MGNVLAIVSFVVATICIALGGFMLYRYWKFVDKATGTITIGSNGTYTYVSNGNTYIVEKNLGFLNLEENKSYTIMLNKEDKTAYVLPFDILDYRYIAWGLILIGVIALLLGIIALVTKSEKDKKEKEKQNQEAAKYVVVNPATNPNVNLVAPVVPMDGSSCGMDGHSYNEYVYNGDGSCGGDHGIDYSIYGI